MGDDPQGRPLLDTMITKVVALDDVSNARDVQDAGTWGKILLLPHGELEETR